MKKTSTKSTLIEWRNALVFAVVVATLFRWSLAEAFVIPTGSMENSLLVGDYIVVSKIHYGPRTPKTPLQVPLTHQKIWGTEIPSYLDWIQLPTYRLPGFRGVERGETVVFNVPKDLLDPTERPMDLMTYLVKRCVAIAGDELEIRDNQVIVNGQALVNPAEMKFQYDLVTSYPLQSQHLNAIGLDGDDYWFLGYSKDNKAVYKVLLTEVQKAAINKAPYLESLQAATQSQSSFPLYPTGKDGVWNLGQYGKLKVPREGMRIQIDAESLDFYGELIEKYEGNHQVKIAGGKLEIDGREVDSYTFKQDYYFMMGDSRDNSIDSRYWGFVPEDHLVGKPILVWFSTNEEGKGLDRVRWGRIFSRID